jgi:predicted secreted hydrolase
MNQKQKMQIRKRIRAHSCAFVSSLVLFLLGGAPATRPVFNRAIGPRDWRFPRDHGRHDRFKLEWWYFTGNLHDAAGRKFGYQLTFFRSGFSPGPTSRPSGWGMNDLYFAHAAVSDLDGKRFVFKDRLERGRPGLAFASDQMLDVSLLDWSARMDGDAIALAAAENNFAMNLKCQLGRGPILQGPGGVNAKWREPGEASYYYSMTRLKTSGTLTLDGRQFKVDGQSWMDHEFSSDPMAGNQIGWDWMGLQLTDGTDLMIYRMRSSDGSADYLSGTRITSDGQPHYLGESDLKITGSDAWTSPTSGGKYPQRWTVNIAGQPPLTVQSEMPGQELITTASTKVTYFEGAAEVRDAAGKPAGEGYLEMTGYVK